MAAEGWLKPEDLIWRAGLAEWIPAQDADEIFPGSLGKLLRETIAGLQPSKSPSAVDLSTDPSPPTMPAKISKPAKAKCQNRAVSSAKSESEVDWSDLSPRHLAAAGGGFLAALGIAFTAIAQSNVALAFTLSGLFIAGAGLYVEIGRLLGQAIENIGKASKEAAERRLRAKELALEKQRLDLEAARLAQEQAAREAPVVRTHEERPCRPWPGSRPTRPAETARSPRCDRHRRPCTRRPAAARTRCEARRRRLSPVATRQTPAEHRAGFHRSRGRPRPHAADPPPPETPPRAAARRPLRRAPCISTAAPVGTGLAV